MDIAGNLHGQPEEFVIEAPVLGSIGSPFGKTRGSRRTQKGVRHHAGVDISSPSGIPIHAAAPGVVVLAAYDKGYGRHVVIQHENGFTTLYAHMSVLSAKAGERVTAGSVIGKVGRTGRATGPHLHFEVKRNGTYVDPEPLLAVARYEPAGPSLQEAAVTFVAAASADSADLSVESETAHHEPSNQ